MDIGSKTNRWLNLKPTCSKIILDTFSQSGILLAEKGKWLFP
jgi:hypothetical protein